MVNEDWAPGASSLRTPEKGGKKVVLGDDTDAKSGDNEPRSKYGILRISSALSGHDFS